MRISTRIFTIFLGLFLSFSLKAGAVIADFTASQTIGCKNMVVNFYNVSSGATSYEWDFGDGSAHKTIASPSHPYYSVGTYTVTLTAYGAGGSSSTKTMTIYVYDDPVVYFRAADTPMCICNTASFIDSSVLNAPGVGTYYWQFGNGDTSSARNPVYNYYCTVNTTGYTVILKVTNSAGCFSSLSKPYYMKVYGHPAIDFGSTNNVICGLSGSVGFTSNISGGPSPYKYDWDFGDGSAHGTDANPIHGYSSSSYRTYDVTLVVTTKAGCKDTIKKIAFVELKHVSAVIATIPANDTICENEYLTVQNVSVPTFDGTTWRFGDGINGSANPEIHSYTAGTYTLKLIATNGICMDSVTKTIRVNPIPRIKFGATPINPCGAPQTITFTDTTSGVTTRRWDFGDHSPYASTTTVSHTYTANGSYDVKLVCSNSYGCSDSLTKYAYINVYDVGVKITGNGYTGEVGSCVPLSVNFSRSATYTSSSGSITAYPFGIDSTWWDFGDGDTSMHIAPSHTYSSYGTYKVKCRIKTVNGCYALDSFTVRTGAHPTANFTASPTTACVHQKIHFTNLTDTATLWEWYFGDNGSSFSKSPDYSYADTGHFSVMLVANNNGCRDTFTRIRYITINLPKAAFGINFDCDTAFKILLADYSKGASTYDWNFGDGSSHATIAQPTHKYSATGSYTITLIVTNTASGCADTVSLPVNIINPYVTLTASDTTVCRDEPVVFTGHVFGTTAVKYYWLFDNTVLLSDTTISVSYAFHTVGLHSVKFMIQDPRNCIDAYTKNNYIMVAHPTVSFSGSPTTGCLPLNVSFINTSTDVTGATFTSVSWDFGDGSPYGSGAPISHTYTAVGSYYVKLIVTDNIGCTDSNSISGYVYVHKPTASFFVSPPSACPGSAVTFTSTSSGLPLTYKWRFGDGGTSTDLMPTHYYSATGTYTVTLIVTDNSGCKDSVSKPITIIAKPHASFTLDDSFSICSPLVVNFTNHSTATGPMSYRWDFGDPTAAIVGTLSPSWTYVNPGLYTVILVVYNTAGCTDTARARVQLLGYKGALSYAPLVGCAPLTVNFHTSVKGVPVFIYDFDDGYTLKTTDTSATHVYTTPGPKIPKLIMTDTVGCSSESDGLDTVLVDGVYHGFFVRPYPTCDSGTIQLLDTSLGAYSSIVKRTWVFHDATISHASNPFHTYHGPGVYSVILIDSTSSGCVDTFNSNVTFYNSPTIDAGPDTTICINDAATLMPTGGVVYTWSPTATLSCATCYNPKASPAVATKYFVIGTDIHGCKNTDSVMVFVKTKTTSYAKEGGEICQGEYFQLHDSAGVGTVYKWVPDYALNNPNIPDPLANPDTSVYYMAVATQASCASDTQTVHVIVHPRPTPNLGPNQTMIAGDGVKLHVAGNNLYKLAWIPPDNLSCDSCQDPIATPKNKQTIYQVQAWSDFGCRDSDDITIIVVCDQSQVFMPNTFTPNGDGQNDVFYPRGKGLKIIKSFRVYNRWGQLMFERKDINTNQKENAWDGTFNGAQLPSDVFVYIVDAICDTGDPMSWKGDISLMR